MLTQIVRSLHYDDLYRQGQAVLDKYNPCNLRVENGVMTCNAMRYSFYKEPCCTDCGNLRDGHGCTVSSLTCKLWLCHWARENYPAAERELVELQSQAIAAGIPYLVRASKAEHMQRASLEEPAFEENLMPFEA